MVNDGCYTRGASRLRKEDGRAMRGSKEYAYHHSPVAEGMVRHHTCGNPACTNPDHIEVMTRADHLREHGLPGDWGQKDKTHCPQNHPYDDENTYVHTRKDGRIERHCKECVRAAKRRYRERLAEKAGW